MRCPVATYRVQLSGAFDFDDAAAIADYLADLGVSHLYASPYLQAAPGSAHGYDVVDHHRLNRELGGDAGHARLCEALDRAGLSQVLDVVPNHMAIGTPENRWWWDVLENGRSSAFAGYFDVDWGAREGSSDDRVLLPVLGDQFGRVIEAGEALLRRDGHRFVIVYHERIFPVAPRSLSAVLARAAARAESDELAYLADAFARLPEAVEPETVRRARDKYVLATWLSRALSQSNVADAVDAEIQVTNGDADLLDALLSQQNYRLAYWRTGRHELEYRRFFDIDNLVGLHMERDDVFEDTHRLIASFVERGIVTGLRIDHPDGLRDPKAYLLALRRKVPAMWIVVEKILEPGESLPDGWPVAGTTGYDFLRSVGGLLLDPAGLERLSDVYDEVTGVAVDWEQLVRESKARVLDDGLRADVDRLVELLAKVCEHHRRQRDHSRLALRETIRALVMNFPVYRSYASRSDDSPSVRDREYVALAVERVRELHPRIDAELLDWLQDILLLRYRGPLETEFALRFQQLTGPAMAKGVEDTAFYRFNRLVGANEVGGDPFQPARSVEAFHEAMAETALRQPSTMLATSTHDTKRSEDVRARLAVLTEIPERWREAVVAWLEAARRYESSDGPDRNTQYLFFQTLVGAWPIDTDRAWQYMEKAIREAKLKTAWTRIDEAYERAVESYVRGVLDDAKLTRSIGAFAREITPAGRINSLSQVLIKLTAPGVPDIYQGSELFDSSLVDPDNRRPVDFELRRRLLAEVRRLPPARILERADEGLPKLWTVCQALATRRALPDVFERGGYRALEVKGARAPYLVAFARDDRVVTLAPRLSFLLDAEGWGDTRVELPERRFVNVFAGRRAASGVARAADVLKEFPVGLLVAEA
jgi:(1->4)-alpha-D-glucan 1-alpha-D-glucosylmutase